MAVKRRAIISVTDKRFLTTFARELLKYGYEILSTGGTYKKLKEAGIPARDLGRTLKTPEMLGGRVKTLHSRVLAGILADLDNPLHVKDLQREALAAVDMVIVNFYPFGERVKAGKTLPQEAVELIDVGGPTMIRAAAKNYKHVSVVSSVEQYREVTRWLKDGEGELTEEQRISLALEAFRTTAEFDMGVVKFLEHYAPKPQAQAQAEPTVTAPAGELLPGKLTLQLTRVEPLRYGENPHQQAARYTVSGLPTLPFKQVLGKELSYNNYQDAAAALAIVSAEYAEPVAACVVKHGNPCGIAIGKDLLKTFIAARDADEKSAFGGIVGLNRPVDMALANELRKTFLEVVIAPDFEAAAVAKLAERKNLHLIKASQTELRALQRHTPRIVFGPFGAILQAQDTVQEAWEDLQLVSNLEPPAELRQDILTGLTYIRYLKSNSICIVKDGVMIGAGVGQLSRVDATEIAIKNAGRNVRGAVLVSDAFFPFADSLEFAAKAKVGCVVAPAGSKRDIEVVEAANQYKLSLIFAPYRHFLH
jgi:phosphoribosylaminoimidazolecarboxamide formyltransferase/IMP cyclohydrolase